MKWRRVNSLTFSLFLICLSSSVSAHTIAEVMKNPISFDRQTINVIGEVADVVTRYGGETPYTTFKLLGADDKQLSVFVRGKPTFKRGDFCRVSGMFVVEKTVGTYALVQGLEAEKIEKLSEAEYKSAGLLFRKKGGSGGKYPRGFYIPQ